MRGTIALIISGEKLDLKEIKENIELDPNRVIKIGQKLPLENIAKCNRWIYEQKFYEYNFEEIMGDFINNIFPFKASIKEFSEMNDVDLNIYINSDYGQLGFSLSTEVIKELEDLSLKLNFHILSYGMVEDNIKE